MSNVEQLEREAEQTRSRIADTMDELRASLTPGSIVDQLSERFSDGAPAAFVRNLKEQAVNNPLPVALMGAALAWLALAPRRFGDGSGQRLRNAAGSASDAAGDVIGRTGRFASDKSAEWSESADRLRDDAGETLNTTTEGAKRAGADVAGKIRDAAGSMSEAARQGASQASETADSVGELTRQGATRAAEAMRGTAGSISDSMQRTASSVSSSARSAGQQTLQSGSAFLDFCREQPMVLAGFGLALGAMMGALLPKSETEDQLLGETSDHVKERAQDLAADKYEAAKNVGERAFEAAKDEAIKQTNPDGRADGSEEHEEKTTGEVKADQATLAPSDESELERRGQPWTSENAPI